MEAININGAILTDDIITEIKYMQAEKGNSLADAHCDALADISDFLISIRDYVEKDKEILDHVGAIRLATHVFRTFQKVD